MNRAAPQAAKGGPLMKFAQLIIGGIFSLIFSAAALAVPPQAPADQAALLKLSPIVFSGTVTQSAATSFAEVPKSDQTIVVRVDSVVKKPAAVSLKRGDSVTVEAKDASAF